MDLEISLVVPVFDEEGNVAPLAHEVAAAFAGWAYEMIFVDDASRDSTLAALKTLKAELPTLRVLTHARNAGQSRAIRTGVMAARGRIIVTLDGDLQNDPADAAALVETLKAGEPRLGMVGGRRIGRQDSVSKKVASKIGNTIRRKLLNDQSDDAGCGLKAFPREAFLRLPYFDHLHRYIPAMMLREGFEIAYLDVSHRARISGRSKYSNWRRLYVSLGDIIGVMWLNARARRPGVMTEL